MILIRFLLFTSRYNNYSLFLYCLFHFTSVSSQIHTFNEYEIQGSLDTNGGTIFVHQTIEFSNPSEEPIIELYLLDWMNAYSDSQSPLSKRLAENFNRRFYLSPDSKKGYTQIQALTIDEKEVQFQRLVDKPDVIKVLLSDFLKPAHKISIKIVYQVKLPDNRFTGIGIKNRTSFTLRDWHLTIAPFLDGNWLLHSNLDLNDNSHLPSNYVFKWTLPAGIHVASNAVQKSSFSDDTFRQVEYVATAITNVDFVFSYRKLFDAFELPNGRTLETDILPSTLDRGQIEESIIKIDNFILETFARHTHPKQLVLQLDHDKNPFYGLNLLPNWIDLYSDVLRFELEFLKSHLSSYLKSLPIDKRKENWIIGGMQIYILIKYIEEYYPDLKFLGTLSKLKILKNYSWNNLDFNKSYLLYVQAVEATQLHQTDKLSKEKLHRENQLRSTPYRVGIGFRYLEEYFRDNLSEVEFEHILKEYFSSQFRIYVFDKKRKLADYFQERVNTDLSWFFEDYLNSDLAFDAEISSLKKQEDKVRFDLLEKNDKKIPVKVSLLSKDKKIIDSHWIQLKGRDTTLVWNSNKAHYLSINPELALPESNRNNNWRLVKTLSNLKPLKFELGFDIDDPTRTQIFYYPWSKYNRYDGITLGARIFNTQEKKQFFEFDTEPLYSVLEDTFVGNAKISLNHFRDNKLNFRQRYTFYFNTFHYDTRLRYTILRPSVRWSFRTADLRSRKRHSAELSFYSIAFDNRANQELRVPNYDILNLRYIYSNREAINYFTLESNFEYSKKFSKAHLELDYRKLRPSGTQIGARFFIGKFLSNKPTDSYFHFKISRATDYLFGYNIYGRSDASGFFSQQYINLEGGFKTDFEIDWSDDFIMATNLHYGLWRYIELYADLGLVRNKANETRTYYGAGIRLNIVPDYFELYFPVFDNSQYYLNNNSYAKHIRFTFFLHPNIFRELGSRRWE